MILRQVTLTLFAFPPFDTPRLLWGAPAITSQAQLYFDPGPAIDAPHRGWGVATCPSRFTVIAPHDARPPAYLVEALPAIFEGSRVVRTRPATSSFALPPLYVYISPIPRSPSGYTGVTLLPLDSHV